MTDKLNLKSSHEVIYTVNVADVESIFYCKPTDPDILTVLMKDGKRLYCDEVCPVDFLQEEPVSEDFEKIVEEIVEPTILNAYGAKELARRLRNTICGTSVSEDLKKAAKANAMVERSDDTEVGYDLNRYGGFIAGALWQKQQFEKERLKHCDELTAEQAQIESDFVTKHLKENSRTPTFIDAIEYGMKLKKEQMMAKAIDARCFGFQGAALFSFRLPADNYLVGSEVKVIVIKED